jgi:hypothetical protein
MKKKTLQIIGDFAIALACAIPTGLLAERQNEGYKYFYNLFIHESDTQLAIMAKLYISRCWTIIWCGISLVVLLMSVYSIIIKANSLKHNIAFIIISLFFAGSVWGINLLLGENESLQFLINVINPIFIGFFTVGFAVTSYFDSKNNIIQMSE